MNRWYDKRPRLGKRLDEFKEMDQKIREPILNEIIGLVKKNKPKLLNSDFRFDSFRLRWYEHDPHLWLVFNILQLADVAILELVEYYLENRRLVR
ncbi:hypothetical protein Ping_1767 [Psychromonas ingrahamii 37]|uniref:Uncharacterized protein n=1 Tax=Psychromonas ingrahamii (strain DSM 17664 / CCUG 51855 / 37) TaxID=357804 RepID=A1SVN5_PSYIN|nr:hypothetical protein [Psychromonas ingrahamii]ABM03550.1 hypothetical protein Ping_1767 [Psychromonas ingrahamii 37]